MLWPHKKRFPYIVLSIFLAFKVMVNTYAQDFKPGYIISITNSRKEGFIQEDNSINQYFGCNFRESEAETVIYYSTENSTEFGYDNRVYQKKSVVMNGSLQEVFLKNEIRGAISLHSFPNKLYVEKGAELRELEIVSSNRNMNNFLFTRLMRDCERSMKRLGDRYSNDLKYIKSVIESYNNCDEKDLDTFRNWNAALNPVIGVEGSTIVLTSSNLQLGTIDGEKIKNLNLLMGGFNLTLGHKNFKRLYFNTGLFYSDKRYQLVLTQTNLGKIDEVRFEYKSLLIPIQFKIQLTKKESWGLFVKSGVRLPVTIDPQSYWISEQEIGSEVTVSKVELFSNYREPTQFSLGISSSIQLSKGLAASLEINYFIASRKSDSEVIPLKLKYSAVGFYCGLIF